MNESNEAVTAEKSGLSGKGLAAVFSGILGIVLTVFLLFGGAGTGDSTGDKFSDRKPLQVPEHADSWKLPTSRDNTNLPEALRDFIPCLDRPVPLVMFDPAMAAGAARYRASVTRAQAMEDIALCEYIFETGYSGRHYWENQGVDFQAIFQELRDRVAGMDTVYTRTIEEVLVNGLFGITDLHLSIQGSSTWTFGRHLDAWMTSVVVVIQDQGQAAGEDLTGLVVRSGDPAAPRGIMITCPRTRFFPIPSPEGEKEYLLGLLSRDYQTHMKVMVNGTERPIALHECRASLAGKAGLEAIASRNEKGPVEIENMEEVRLVRVKTFSDKFHDQLRVLSSQGAALRSRSLLLVDICGNGGGSSSYPEEFFKALNGRAVWNRWGAELVSPATVQSWVLQQRANPSAVAGGSLIDRLMKLATERLPGLEKNPRAYWKLFDSPRELLIPPQEQENLYGGRLVLLMNRAVCSSAEAAVSYARSIPGALLMGENSRGMGTYGEPRPYRLPNTGITLMLPSKLFVAPDMKEGEGYMPDYWIDSSDPAREAARWLAQGDEYRFSPCAPPPASFFLDFDTPDAQGGVAGVSLEIGAVTGQGPVSEFGISPRASEGSGCLSLRAGDSTGRFLFISRSLPWGIGKAELKFRARVEGVRLGPGQYPNCFVGFVYKNSSGEKVFRIKSFSGSSDWQEQSLSLDLIPEGPGAGDISLAIFLSMSGELLVDSLSVESTPAPWGALAGF